MSQTDFLTSKINEIRNRVNELAPQYEEYLELEKVMKAFESAREKVSEVIDFGLEQAGVRKAPARKKSGAATAKKAKPAAKPAARKTATKKATTKKPAAKKSSTARKPGRPKGVGSTARGGKTRTSEALDTIKKNPGITVAELSTKLGINQNYVYRVVAELRKNKQIVKQGKGLKAA